MKKVKPLTITLMMILVMPVIALASPPAIPLFVYGDVTIDGQPAPLNTEILAEIDNLEVAKAVLTNEGKYFIEIPDGKANEGKIIIFKVNGITNDNNQLLAVNIDTIPTINLDLAITTLSEPEPEPEPSPVPTGSGGGSGGGGGGGSTPPTTPSSTTQGDINEDDKVDKYDFALMMANWGKTGSNDSDLNEDGKVDKYDFALLMVNWGI